MRRPKLTWLEGVDHYKYERGLGRQPCHEDRGGGGDTAKRWHIRKEPKSSLYSPLSLSIRSHPFALYDVVQSWRYIFRRVYIELVGLLVNGPVYLNR
jgi:hypothetical protein